MSSDVTVVYDGRAIPKASFRVYVYGENGTKRLVNSWEAYEDALKSGLWHTHKEDVCSHAAEIGKAIGNMPKQRRK